MNLMTTDYYIYK